MEKTRQLSDKLKCPTWKKRNRMERYLILLCIVFFVIFIIMVSLLTYFIIIYNRNPNVCNSPVCYFTAGRILEKMDYSVRPCDDFYNFSCGSYLKYKNIYNDKIDAKSDLRGSMLRLLKEILEKPENQNEPRFVRKVRKYYQSCLKNSPSIKELLDDFLKFTKFDEWPVADDDKNEFEETMAKSVLYSTDQSFLFYVFISYKGEFLDSIMIGNSKVSIREHGLLNTTEDSIRLKQQYLDLFQYVFSKLEMKEEDAKNFTDEIIQLETSLARITNRKYIDNTTRMTVLELELECPEIKWPLLIENIYKYLNHQSNYSNDLIIEISNMNYIMEVCQFVKENNPRIIHNLIVWNSFARYLYRTDFIFSELLNILGENSELRISMPWDNKPKWKSCINNFEIAYTYGLHYMLLKAEDYKDKINKIENYLKHIINEAKEITDKQKWIDYYSKRIIGSMMKDIKYEIGYHRSLVNEQKINEIFDKIDVTDSYLYNILQAKKYLFWDFLFNGVVNKLEFQNHSHSIPSSPVAVFIKGHLGGKLEVPVALMFPPYYFHGAPNYLNFGGIGSILGHEISHNFDYLDEKERRSEYNKGINWPPEFLGAYERRKFCLTNQYSKMYRKTYMKHNIARSSGLIQAYRVYEKYLQNHGNEPKLPGLDFSNRQMFFIGFAQKECERREFVKDSIEGDYHTPGRYSVLIPLMNFPEFSKSFNCPMNSYMNKAKKCKLWD